MSRYKYLLVLLLILSWTLFIIFYVMPNLYKGNPLSTILFIAVSIILMFIIIPLKLDVVIFRLKLSYRIFNLLIVSAILIVFFNTFSYSLLIGTQTYHFDILRSVLGLIYVFVVVSLSLSVVNKRFKVDLGGLSANILLFSALIGVISNILFQVFLKFNIAVYVGFTGVIIFTIISFTAFFVSTRDKITLEITLYLYDILVSIIGFLLMMPSIYNCLIMGSYYLNLSDQGRVIAAKAAYILTSPTAVASYISAYPVGSFFTAYGLSIISGMKSAEGMELTLSVLLLFIPHVIFRVFLLFTLNERISLISVMALLFSDSPTIVVRTIYAGYFTIPVDYMVNQYKLIGLLVSVSVTYFLFQLPSDFYFRNVKHIRIFLDVLIVSFYSIIFHIIEFLVTLSFMTILYCLKKITLKTFFGITIGCILLSLLAPELFHLKIITILKSFSSETIFATLIITSFVVGIYILFKFYGFKYYKVIDFLKKKCFEYFSDKMFKSILCLIIIIVTVFYMIYLIPIMLFLDLAYNTILRFMFIFVIASISIFVIKPRITIMTYIPPILALLAGMFTYLIYDHPIGRVGKAFNIMLPIFSIWYAYHLHRLDEKTNNTFKMILYIKSKRKIHFNVHSRYIIFTLISTLLLIHIASFSLGIASLQWMYVDSDERKKSLEMINYLHKNYGGKIIYYYSVVDGYIVSQIIQHAGCFPHWLQFNASINNILVLVSNRDKLLTGYYKIVYSNERFTLLIVNQTKT